jgi:ABC-type phosphate transport system permease subunit
MVSDQFRAELKRLNASIQTIQETLGDLDRQLMEERRLIRRAALLEQVEIDRTYDDVVEAAFALGATEQQGLDLVASLRLWDQIWEERTEPLSMKSIRNQLEDAIANERLLRNRELEGLLTSKVQPLPPMTRQAFVHLSDVAKQIAMEQIRWNTQLAELEIHQEGYRITLALPQYDRLDSNRLGASEVSIEQSMGVDGFPAFVWRKVDQGSESTIPLATIDMAASDVVRAFAPNRLSFVGKLGVYASRWTEFLLAFPRQAGMTGGVFPAIWGTIAMTLLMSLMVVPFGVVAAIYIHEYAESSWLISLVRITINNLAGVPSIVYGVFGLAFFCHTIGGFVDGGPTRVGIAHASVGTWWRVAALTLGLSVAFVLLIGRGPHRDSHFWNRLRSVLVVASFASVLVGLLYLVATCPFFDGLYREDLPNPTFGKGCLLWASLTLALLTLPVVIVSTEESLAAVPHSLREGSYACGASKWQTLYRLVIPHARPGILTGFILSMARGAGEVAPLMLVGAIPLATDLPVDGKSPFLHGSRAFMHLGFQIYSLGFQSQDSVAAKPIVFSTTLLLLVIVWTLNAAAIWMRARLRCRTQSNYF